MCAPEREGQWWASKDEEEQEEKGEPVSPIWTGERQGKGIGKTKTSGDDGGKKARSDGAGMLSVSGSSSSRASPILWAHPATFSPCIKVRVKAISSLVKGSLGLLC